MVNACCNYPNAFFKKAIGILQLHPSVLPSVTVSPPKLLDEIQLNLVLCVAHMNGVCNDPIFICPAPWCPEEGQEVKYY